MTRSGTLPSQHLRELIQKGFILNANPLNIQPASLDLALGEKIYRLPHIFLPPPNQTVEETAFKIGAEKWSFDYPLEVNIPYLVKLAEELKLPDDVYGYSNPKSSSGRVDLKVTMLADRISRFDSAGQPGYQGSLWLIIEPKSFRVKVGPGDKLIQLRLFYSDTRLRADSDLKEFYQKYQPIFKRDGEPLDYERLKISDRDGGLILTIDLNGERVGWRCERRIWHYLDFSKKDKYKPEDFFTPVISADKTITLRRGDFYVLSTREKLRVPPGYAAELAAMDVRSGEYRSHYAGFIDPGFGYGREG